jgi:cytoskeletal protein CcmA (bactofilin family)
MGFFDRLSEPSTPQPIHAKEAEMLNMGKRDEKQSTFDRADYGATNGVVESRASSAGEKTVIGENLSIEGTIRAAEDMVIDGTVKGTIEIKSHQLTVGPKGRVDADIEADSVVVNGRMTGNIVAKNKVHVAKSADFTGQIKSKRISVEDGAYIKASIELDRDDKPQAPARSQSSASSSGMDGVKSAKSEPQKSPVLAS